MPATPSVSLDVLSATTVMVSATAGADTSHIQFDRSWVTNTGSNDLEVACSTGNTTTQYFSMPTQQGNYTVNVRARINSTASSWVTRGFTVSPPPDPDPAITSLSVSGNSAISASWSVSNSQYLRPSNSISIYLSGANNSTQHFQRYLGASERSWSYGLDGAGNALVSGSTYTVWVYAYNSSGSSFGTSSSTVFSKPKPSSFNWSTAKTSGGRYNLTYSEWSGFLDAINLFRGYKGLSQVSFNRSQSNGIINSFVSPSASSFNAAVNTINTMYPSISAPSTVTSGTKVTASHFNRIRDSLNSIS